MANRVTYTGEAARRVSVDLDEVEAMTEMTKEVVQLWMRSGQRLEVRASFNTVLEQAGGRRGRD